MSFTLSLFPETLLAIFSLKSPKLRIIQFIEHLPCASSHCSKHFLYASAFNPHKVVFPPSPYSDAFQVQVQLIPFITNHSPQLLQTLAEDGAGPCSKQGCSGHLAQAGAYARVVVGNWSEFTACSICFLHFVSIWSIKEKNL